MPSKPEHDPPGHKHKFIVIEGVDGVGKTTVAKALAARLGAVYVRTPSLALESFQMLPSHQNGLSLRAYADQQAYSDPKVRFAFYLFAVLDASVQVEALLRSSSVVCDRYLSSTLAYHRVLAPELAAVDVSWVQSIRPDLEVVLDVSDKRVHLDRLQARAARSDRALERNFRFLQLVRQEYQRLGLTTIDTAVESVDQVVTRIASMIECLTPGR